jgi:hypothetical protein
MRKLGILTEEKYLAIGERRRFSGAHVAYNLLDVGTHPSPEQIRVFEDISCTLRTSNGTFRTTFRNRFEDVNAVAMRWIKELHPDRHNISVQDRAVSHGLTAKEFAEQVFQTYPDAEFEASDLLLSLVELSLDNGDIYIVEQDGTPLQYIRAPFVVSVHHPEPLRYPLNRWVSAKARRRFQNLSLPQGWTKTTGGPGFKVRQIPYIHPEARALTAKNPRFQFRIRSVFDRTPEACQVLRTMNIFNRSYFTPEQLADGAAAVHESLTPDGLWIVGRTLEEDLSNHAAFLRRKNTGWELLDRVGSGSEIEEIVLGPNAAPKNSLQSQSGR